VYRRSTEGKPVFVEVPAPTHEALQAVVHNIITRTMRLLTRRGVLLEERLALRSAAGAGAACRDEPHERQAGGGTNRAKSCCD
jgi:hypothetical protein